VVIFINVRSTNLSRLGLLFLVLFVLNSLNLTEQGSGGIFPNVRSSVPLFTYVDHSPVDIQDDIALADNAIQGTGTNNDPFILEGWRLAGIQIQDTTKFFIIRNCFVEENGIILRNNSGSPKIVNNHIINVNNRPYQYANDYRHTAEDAAIYLRYCNTSLVQNNTCIGEISLEDSSNPTLTENRCQDGGIYLNFCESASITSNTILNSDFDGIHINHCAASQIEDNICIGGYRYGLALYYSSSVRLTNNTFNDFGEHGICFAVGTLQERVSDCVVSRNILKNNSEYGIKIEMLSSNNTFHHNSFIDNGLSPQAYDLNTNDNLWYDSTTEEGNYWSDHPECDPYILAGGGGEVTDPHPLDANLNSNCDQSIPFNISAFLFITTISWVLISIFLAEKRIK